MSWELAAPDAADALLTLAQTIPNVDVADGQKVSGSGKPLALIIGWADQQHDGIEHTIDGPAFTPNQEDQFAVHCRAEALISPDSTISTARRAAYGLLATFAGKVYADPTLGVAAVMNAVIEDVAYATVQLERGHFAVVHFAVLCDSFTGD